jgi:Flp pilus assembly CpaE family ATPase
MPAKYTKKDPFEDVDSDFKDAVASMSTDEIRSQIVKVSINQMELMEAKKEDQDLSDKREAYNDANSIYRDGTKQNRLKLEFCKRVLGDKGGC